MSYPKRLKKGYDFKITENYSSWRIFSRLFGSPKRVVLRNQILQLRHITPKFKIDTPEIQISRCGEMVITPFFDEWDGASGPTIDTASSWRGSLFHDGLFWCYEHFPECFTLEDANNELRDICIEDGMWQWRAKLWEIGTDIGGRFYV